jgi:hypothetical protein
MIHAIQANEHLQIWDLCDHESSEVDWDLHIMGVILEGIQDHLGLCEIKTFVRHKERAFGPNFAGIRKLITHNRQIVVKDDTRIMHSDGRVIDELYSLHHFYQGSTALAKPPFPAKATLRGATVVRRDCFAALYESFNARRCCCRIIRMCVV